MKYSNKFVVVLCLLMIDNIITFIFFGHESNPVVLEMGMWQSFIVKILGFLIAWLIYQNVTWERNYQKKIANLSIYFIGILYFFVSVGNIFYLFG